MFDESKIVLQFAAVSDLQHGYEPKMTKYFDTGERGRECFRQLRELALQYNDRGLDAVFFAGDIINNAKASQVESFKAVYEDVLDPAQTPFIFCLGNHDIFSGRSYTHHHLNMDTFYRILGDAYRTYEPETSDPVKGFIHQIVGGYHFLAIDPLDSGYVCEKGDDSGAKYAPEAKEWLDTMLAKITAEQPDRYVFVTTHPMIHGLAYGGDLVFNTLYWYAKELVPILEKYPQVVAFGGHLHFPISDERSIMQDKFTGVNCGAMSYMAIENGGYQYMANATVMLDASEVSNGYLAQLDAQGNLRLIRMNFGLKKTIKDPFVLPAPAADGSHLWPYSRERRVKNNQPPVLAENAISVADNGAWVKDEALRVAVSFRSGTDDDAVQRYVLTVTEDGKEVETARLLADGYLYASSADMKLFWTVDLAENTYFKGHTYTVALTAYDCWDAESNTVTCIYCP